MNPLLSGLHIPRLVLPRALGRPSLRRLLLLGPQSPLCRRVQLPKLNLRQLRPVPAAVETHVPHLLQREEPGRGFQTRSQARAAQSCL